MLSRCNKLQFHHSGDQTEIFVMEIKKHVSSENLLLEYQ